MTDPAHPGSPVAEEQPPRPDDLPNWQTFARTHDWQRAQVAASLKHAGMETQAALSALSALQEDVRAKRYAAARRALGSYRDNLKAALTSAPGEAALLQSLAPPEVLEAALTSLDSANGESDPVSLQHKLAGAQAHHLTRAEALNALGVLHALRAEQNAARDRFEEALAHDPGHYRARMNLGNLALEAGDPQGAEREYREVLKIAPEYDGAHHNLGVALRRQGKVYESVGAIRRAQRLNVRQTRQEGREEMRQQMRSNPQMRLIRNVVIGVILLVVVLSVLQGR